MDWRVREKFIPEEKTRVEEIPTEELPIRLANALRTIEVERDNVERRTITIDLIQKELAKRY